jgi:predicted protein tyrosine phosphatase
VEAAVAVANRLDLAFDDVEVAAAGDTEAALRAWGRRRWAAENGLVEVAPSAADVADIVRFAEVMRGAGGVLLCHCGAGMSRAPAAALICMAVWAGVGAEVECVRAVREVRPGATPHAGLVRMADEVLGRGGALVRAVMATARDGG